MSKIVDYSKTLMYKIVCNDTTITDLYVGSTTDFTKRQNSHKRACIYSCQNRHHLKVYQFIRANGGWDNWSMVMIEKYPCENQLEQSNRERFWKEELKATLNIAIPSRTRNEKNRAWYNNNKQRGIEKTLRWQKKNEDYLKEKITCECGSILYRCNKPKHIKTQKHINLLSHKPSVVIE
jgi:hypothetical protein